MNDIYLIPPYHVSVASLNPAVLIVPYCFVRSPLSKTLLAQQISLINSEDIPLLTLNASSSSAAVPRDINLWRKNYGLWLDILALFSHVLGPI